METAESNHGRPADSVVREPRTGPSAWLAIVVAVLAGFGPPLAPVSGGLDSGWQLGLSWARELGLRWGSDVIFTYGPWGHLVAAVPLDSSLVWSAVVAQAVALSLVAWGSCRLTEASGRWWSALLAAPVTAAAASSGLATALFLGIVLACIVLALDARRPVFLASIVGGLAGLSALIKFNTGCAALAIGVIAMLSASRWRAALAAFIVSAGASLLGGWIAADQSVRDLGPWLRGSVELAAGYRSAMRHVREDLAGWLPLAVFAFGAGMAALLGAMGWLHGAGLPTRRRAALAAALGGAASALYLASATRLDAGHLGMLPCGLFALGVPIAGSLGRSDAPASKRRLRFAVASVVSLALVCLAVSVGILGKEGAAHYFHPISSLETINDELKLAVSENARSTRLAAEKAAIRDRYPVPSWELKTLNPRSASLAGPSVAVIDALRGGTVHVEPWAISLAWAHGLEWKPVPVLQSYAAHSRHLDERNAESLRSRNGPAGVLRQSAAIDDKNPLWESPRYQLAMLCNFRQVASDRSWQALVRTGDRCGPPQVLSKSSLRIGEAIRVPRVDGALVIAELSPQDSSAGARRTPVSVLCGSAAYRLSQGAPSGPLLMRAGVSGWESRTMPAPCETLSADRPVEVVFSSVEMNGR